MTSPSVRRRFFTRAALCVLVAGSLLRFARWGMPLTSDEAFMLHFYSSRSYRHVVTVYKEANNHMLLALALRAIDDIYPKKLIHTLADHKPLQFPVILTSITALVLLYLVALRVTSPPAALLSLTAFALSHWQLSYSQMLRGYSPSIMANLLNVWIVLEALRRPKFLYALPLGLAAAHYIIPINLFFSMALFTWSWIVLRSRRPGRALGGPLILAFSAGIFLTGLAWWPLIGDMIAHAGTHRVPLTLGNFFWRWTVSLSVVGKGWFYQFYFAAIAAVGFGFALSRNRRWPLAASLIASYLIVPPLITVFQGTMPPFRVYTSSLPFWALAHGLGLYALGDWLRRRLPSPWNSLRAACLLLIASSVALAGGQWMGFLSRHSGLNPREVMIRMSKETREWDDFAVIYNQVGVDPDLWELAWEYYGYAAHIEPFVRLGRYYDFPYLLRSHYVILAKDLAQAQDSAALSDLDPFLREGLSESGVVGDVRVFRIDLDSAVLARYRAALASPGAEPRRRAMALTGLGYSELRKGDLRKAVEHLEKAKVLDGGSKRIRYLLGLAHYLSFDDAKAVPELLRSASEGGNVHAPFYLADALAELGRNEEASRWYAWYRKAPMHPGVWFNQARAARGEQGLSGGLGRVRRTTATADAWDRAAAQYYNKGAYERAVLAAGKAQALAPSPSRLAVMARIEHVLRDYAGAVKTLRQAVAQDGSAPHKIMLARQLLLRRGYAEASRLMAEVLRSEPENVEAQGLAKALRRF